MANQRWPPHRQVMSLMSYSGQVCTKKICKHGLIGTLIIKSLSVFYPIRVYKFLVLWFDLNTQLVQMLHEMQQAPLRSGTQLPLAVQPCLSYAYCDA
jgi:hypothetical protein